MERWLAARFGPKAGGGPDPRAALAPHPAWQLHAGPLKLAYTGPETPGGEIVCLLDGRLDNAEELRVELGAAPSEADSDERLLTAAYRRWGAELAGRMRGDFVLFAWDRRHEHGLLARDQLGVRPVFVHGGPENLVFAGELAQLLALLPSRPDPDEASLAHWIAASTRPGPETLFAGIRRLPPGAAMVFSARRAREVRYWEPRFEGALDLPPEELAEQVRARLATAVRRRASGRRSAVLMSGGLDSSAVAAIATHEASERPLACSAVFPEHPETDESALIGELRQRLELRGPLLAVRAGGLLRSMLAHLERWQAPPVGWGDFWTEELIRAAAEAGVTTVLDGDGGDEVFGPRSHLVADRLRRGHPLQALSLAAALPGGGPQIGRRQLASTFLRLGVAGAIPEPAQRPLRSRGIRREAPSWMLPATRRALGRSDDPYAWKRLRGPRWWAHAAHGISRGIEQTGIFEHQRRRAAALGVEAAHPMLDLDLVELCLRTPPVATLDQRFNRPVLRDAMRGSLPEEVRLRPAKAWFDALIVECLAGADGEAVRSLLGDPRAELGAYVDLAAMRAALLDDENARRRQPFRWMWQVWRLVGAECWLRSQTQSSSQILASLPALSEARVEPLEGADSYLFHP
jgi:asparagine synthase (glutamine-hydrolysing)